MLHKVVDFSTNQATSSILTFQKTFLHPLNLALHTGKSLPCENQFSLYLTHSTSPKPRSHQSFSHRIAITKKRCFSLLFSFDHDNSFFLFFCATTEWSKKRSPESIFVTKFRFSSESWLARFAAWMIGRSPSEGIPRIMRCHYSNIL